VTGFFFPFHGITPGIVVGAISLVVLAVAVVAWNKRWAKTYIVAATIAEFFNVLVLIVQSFQKIAPLHELAPKGTEPITNVAKLLALVFFVVVAWVAIRRGRFVL
jgi:riboflavin transporter FmnP